MKLVIAEKPSVAKSIASALGASSRADGYYEVNDLIVSWCVGHLVSPMDAAGYDERFKKWHYDDSNSEPHDLFNRYDWILLPDENMKSGMIKRTWVFEILPEDVSHSAY